MRSSSSFLLVYLVRVGVPLPVLLVAGHGVAPDGLAEPVQDLVMAAGTLGEESVAPPVSFLARSLPGLHLVPGLGRTGGQAGVVRVLGVCQGLRVGVRQRS